MHSRILKIVGGLATLGAAASLLGLGVFAFAMFPLSAFIMELAGAGWDTDWSQQIPIPSIGVQTSLWVVYVIPYFLLCVAAPLAIGSAILLSRSHVRRAGLATALVMLLTLSVSTYLFCYRPFRPGYLGAVSVTLGNFQTNAADQVTALVTVSNAGPYALELPFGCQVMMGESDGTGVMHRPVGDSVIEPGDVRYVSVAPPSEPNYWRVQAHCVKHYPPGWSSRMHSFVDAYVLKRQVWEVFSTPEIFQ